MLRIFNLFFLAILVNYSNFTYATFNKSIIKVPINGDFLKSKQLTINYVNNVKSIANRHIQYDQFFIYNTDELTRIIDDLSLKNFTILDIGAGTGVISNILISKKISHLIISEIDPNICYDLTKTTYLTKGDFRKFSLPKVDLERFGIISNPPYYLLPYIRDFIDKEKIANVILIIPASYYTEFFSDFNIVGSIKNEDFYPQIKLRDQIYLIIKKGFQEPDAIEIHPHQIMIGRYLISIEEFILLLKNKYKLSKVILKQIPEHIGGRRFETLDSAIEWLSYKEKSQAGDLFHHIQHANLYEQADLIKRYRFQLSDEEIKLLQISIVENNISDAAWLAFKHSLDTQNIIIGQRSEMQTLVDNGIINEKEILNIHSNRWNWSINRVWMNANITLKKKFIVALKDTKSVYNTILKAKTGQEFLEIGKKEKNKYIYHVNFKRPTYLGREISMLIDAGYKFTLETHKAYLIIVGKYKS